MANISRYNYGSLGFDDSSSGTRNVSIDVGSGSNRVLLAFLSNYEGGWSQLTSISYNGSALTLEKTQGSGDGIRLYYILNPDSGTNNLSIVRNSSFEGGLFWVVYENVHQTNLFDVTTQGASGDSLYPTDQITPVSNDTMVVAGGVHQDYNEPLSPDDGQTELADFLAGSGIAQQGFGGEIAVATAAATDMGWTSSGSADVWDIIVCALRKAETEDNDERSAKITGGYESKVSQSIELVAPATNIVKAVLMPDTTTPGDSSISWSLSADGGSNWESVTENTEHTFSNQGQSLKWKATHNPSTDKQSFPTISKVVISYDVATAGTEDNDERAAKIIGSTSANDTKAAKITGQDLDNSERSVKVTGEGGGTALRSARIVGVDADNDIRSAKVAGVEGANDERSAVITGQDSSNDTRSAKILGGYDTPQYLYWSKINSNANNVLSAIVYEKEVTTPNDSSIDWHLSNDGGSSWEAVTEGANHTFVSSGNDLRARATLNASTDLQQSPSVDRVSFLWDEEILLNVNDEKDAKITGIAGANDTRSAVVTGKDTDFSDRSAKATGQQLDNNARAATIDGQDAGSSSRSAKLAGDDSGNDSRPAKVTGVDTDNSERAAKIVGSISVTSEISSKISGVDTIEDTRNASITGSDDSSDTRSAKLTGVAGANDIRAAKTTGVDTDSNERATKIVGKESDNSSRSAKTTGVAGANSVRGSRIVGVDADNNERASKITGSITVTSERSAAVDGQDTGSSTRPTKIVGNQSNSSVASAKIHGIDTDFNVRSAKVTGQESSSDTKAAKITGQDTTSSTRSVKITGQGDTVYSKQYVGSLPSGSDNLSSIYSAGDISDVENNDSVYVRQEATQAGYIVHQYKDYNVNNDNSSPIFTSWNGKATVAPSTSTFYLQVYNVNSTTWETVDSNSVAGANVDFTLTAQITENTENYYDANYVTTFRLYQQIT